jgi:hypothetical protein
MLSCSMSIVGLHSDFLIELVNFVVHLVTVRTQSTFQRIPHILNLTHTGTKVSDQSTIQFYSFYVTVVCSHLQY